MNQKLLAVIFVCLCLLACISDFVDATCHRLPGPPGPPPGPPCNCGCSWCSGSPSFPKIGNYMFTLQDLSLPTRGLPISVTRNYDTQRPGDGLFGVGWNSSLTARLTYGTYLYMAPSTYFNEAVITYPDGYSYTFRENPDGSFSPPFNRHDSLIKNGDGSFDLTLQLSRTRYHFSFNGTLTSVTDDYGNTLTYLHDGNGRLTSVSDAAGSGRSVTISYGGDGRVSTIQDSTGRIVQYAYDASGTLQTVTDPAGRQTHYSYAQGRFAPVLSQIRDHWNRVITDMTYYPYDAYYVHRFGRLKSYTEAGETYTYDYPAAGTSATKTSTGGTWTFEVAADALVTKRIPPSGSGGAEVSSSFYPDQSLQMSTDETGIKTFYTYNPDGSVATLTRDYQGAQAVRFDYQYDAAFPGKVTAITPKNPSTGAVNPDWQAWQYDYYQGGSAAPGALYHVYRVRSDGTTLDMMATYSYNSAGQVLTVTDAFGAVTSYSYNSTNGDLASVTYPKNSTSGPNPLYQYGRDAAGRVTSVIDPLGKTTSYTYDSIDRILTVTLPKPSSGSPLNFVTTYSYDNFDTGSGLLFTHQTDPNSLLTKQGYDQYGQMRKSIDALSNTTTFFYDKGLLASITDANNNVTTYTYNPLRRLSSTQFPDGGVESYTYYTDGLLYTKTDRKNQTMTYTYDRLKRLTQKSYPNGSSISYNYTGQKLMSVNDTFAGETHSFTYDSSYRVDSNTQGSRGTLNYTYGSSDRVSSYSVSGGPSATYTYYDDGSLNTISWSPVSGQFQYAYTLNGQYSTITFPNNQQRVYSYDDQGRLTQLANIHPQAGNLSTYDYGYDVDHYTGQSTMLGQRTSMNATVPTQNFANSQTKYYYDANYQLTRSDYPNVAPFNSEIDSWTYDAIGNRLTNTVNGATGNYTYFKNGSNPLNGQRLQSDGSNTYAYDNNGNTTSRTGYTFTWDYEDRLTAISGGVSATYSYDYQGRRTSKTLNGVTTTYLYNRQDAIRETSTSTADYLFGTIIDEPLAVSRASWTHYYNADALGSVGILNDAPGSIQNNYVLDAWGALKSQNEPLINPYTFTGREAAEAGLMYYRARYYRPTTGMFISQDQLTLEADFGHWPSYSYLNDNPVISTDPYGLYSIDESCNCPAPGGPPPPPGPAGPPSWGDLIRRETDDFCKTKLNQITNPKRKKCLEERCTKNGKVKCEKNCDSDEAGFHIWGKTVHFCTNTYNGSPGSAGRIVIHEFAHSCDWHDCWGEGVPDNHKCDGKKCLDCKR